VPGSEKSVKNRQGGLKLFFVLIFWLLFYQEKSNSLSRQLSETMFSLRTQSLWQTNNEPTAYLSTFQQNPPFGCTFA
jgi:hypothetical protein